MVSIIIPVYNVETYLPKCINSVLAQTYKDWELILIDDGSKDMSGFICDDYAKNDERIIVVHQDNKGVSYARNRGLSVATGQFVCFIDSDDWIDPNFLENFSFSKYHVDLYISGALYDTYGKVFSYKKYKEAYCTTLDEISSTFIHQHLVNNGYPWGKLFRRELIQKYNLKFDTHLTIHEDHIFILQYCSHIRSMYVTETANYHYTVFDVGRRKLSNNVHNYKELIAASIFFNDLLTSIKLIWNVHESVHKEWMDKFFWAKRLLAMRSLILNGEKIYLSNEVIFWRKANYIPQTKEAKILLSIVRSHIMSSIKYLILKLYYLSKKYYNRKNYVKLIYADLKLRSTVIMDEKD